MSPQMMHLTDDELQSISEGAAPRTAAAMHLAGCAACQADVEGYRQLSLAVAAIEQPEPPTDFTAAVLARLPAPAVQLGASDLLAVVLATAAALLGVVLFRQGNIASVIFQALHHLPGRALAEAVLAAAVHGHHHVSSLLLLCGAALFLVTPLWRLTNSAAAPRVVA